MRGRPKPTRRKPVRVGARVQSLIHLPGRIFVGHEGTITEVCTRPLYNNYAVLVQWDDDDRLEFPAEAYYARRDEIEVL